MGLVEIFVALGPLMMIVPSFGQDSVADLN